MARTASIQYVGALATVLVMLAATAATGCITAQVGAQFLGRHSNSGSRLFSCLDNVR
jgi:hypothetical protein